jgi:AAA domain (dynein-related subfamily)
MAEYAVSTNLISWVPAKGSADSKDPPMFGWPQEGPEAETVEELNPGDYLIPKFAQNPDYRRTGSQEDYVRGICEVLKRSYDDEKADYHKRVAGGAGAVLFVWRVKKSLGDDGRFPSTEPWSIVEIEVEELQHPISTSEFLRLRVIPIELARQFKATAAPGRHIQKVSDGTAAEILKIGKEPTRDYTPIRRLSLVKATDAEAARAVLQAAGRGPEEHDLAFLVSAESMLGAFTAGAEGKLEAEGEAISRPPATLQQLIEDAKARATESDHFQPGNALAAAKELAEFVDGDEQVKDIGEFALFHDRYAILPRKVSQALELAGRPLPPGGDGAGPGEEGEEEEEDVEDIELDALHGLTISAVQAQLSGIVLPSSVLAEAVTALRSGKHLLLSGPPGTGKSTVAAALCRAVVGSDQFEIATATADWTTFDTIGGYIPRSGGALEFEPGIVLRCLERGRWLIIDELNRADIDKAFGPLFTLLSASGEAGGDDVVLPFKKGEKNVRIVWAKRRDDAPSPYALTPVWRLLGTLNVRDKATLFNLSFAFLRRFAVIDVPLPDEPDYRDLYAGWVGPLEEPARSQTIDAAMKVAFGSKQLGPAILKDIARFTAMGLTATETAAVAAPYSEPVEAFLTAVRLYGVPQYEGASKAAVDDLLQRLRSVWDAPPAATWQALSTALEGVRLA